MNCMPPICTHLTKTFNIPWKSSKRYVHLEKQFSPSSLQVIAVRKWEIFISATWKVPLLQGNRTEFTIFYDFGCKVCLALVRPMYLWQSLEPTLLFQDVRETHFPEIRHGFDTTGALWIFQFMCWNSEVKFVESQMPPPPTAEIFLDLTIELARLWNNEWRSIVEM